MSPCVSGNQEAEDDLTTLWGLLQTHSPAARSPQPGGAGGSALREAPGLSPCGSEFPSHFTEGSEKVSHGAVSISGGKLLSPGRVTHPETHIRADSDLI